MANKKLVRLFVLIAIVVALSIGAYIYFVVNKNEYHVTVDYDTTTEDYTDEYTQINFDGLPLITSGKPDVTIELVHFDYAISTVAAVEFMEQEGVRPANIYELLALGIKYPNLQKKFPIAALGPWYTGLHPCLLYKTDIGNIVDSINCPRSEDSLDWDPAFRFAVVSESTELIVDETLGSSAVPSQWFLDWAAPSYIAIATSYEAASPELAKRIITYAKGNLSTFSPSQTTAFLGVIAIHAEPTQNNIEILKSLEDRLMRFQSLDGGWPDWGLVDDKYGSRFGDRSMATIESAIALWQSSNLTSRSNIRKFTLGNAFNYIKFTSNTSDVFDLALKSVVAALEEDPNAENILSEAIESLRSNSPPMAKRAAIVYWLAFSCDILGEPTQCKGYLESYNAFFLDTKQDGGWSNKFEDKELSTLATALALRAVGNIEVLLELQPTDN